MRQCFPEDLQVFIRNSTFIIRVHKNNGFMQSSCRARLTTTGGDVIFLYESTHTELHKDVLHFLFIAFSERLIVSQSPFQELLILTAARADLI